MNGYIEIKSIQKTAERHLNWSAGLSVEGPVPSLEYPVGADLSEPTISLPSQTQLNPPQIYLHLNVIVHEQNFHLFKLN